MFNPYSNFARLYQNLEFLHTIAAMEHALVTGDTILTRLWLCTGLPIIKKIMNDGLMEPDEGYPFITNGFGYRFQDQRVAEAWRALNPIASVPVDSHTLNMSVSMSNYFSFHRNPWKTHPRVIGYETALKEYRNKSVSRILSYTTNVLQHAERGETNIADTLCKEREMLLEELNGLWKHVETRKFSVAAVLRREGLPLKNYIFN